MSDVLLSPDLHFEQLREAVWRRLSARERSCSRERFEDAYAEWWSREVERETTSSMVRMFETGRPLASRSFSWIAPLSECGSTRVRTTQAIGVSFTLSALAASGT